MHTSTSLVPKKRSGWASWIYTRFNDQQMSATYWMNRLQKLNQTTDYFVTLNPQETIPTKSQIYSTIYEHPMMTKQSIETQPYLQDLNNGHLNTFFCVKVGFFDQLLVLM